MKVTFHPEARDELVAAADYYESAVPGLGNRFLFAVRRATDLAVAHPEAGSVQAGLFGDSSFADFLTMWSIKGVRMNFKSWLSRTTIGDLGTGANGNGAEAMVMHGITLVEADERPLEAVATPPHFI